MALFSLLTRLRAFITALFMFGQFIMGTFNGHVVVVSPPAVLPSTHIATSSSSTLATTTKATSTAPKPSPAKAPSEPSIATTTIPAAPIVLLPTEDVNASTRAALVNILCTTQAGGSFEPISGSGVFIDSRGVILTNAHVGQYFLLRNYGVTNNVVCVVRTGSPAQATYIAELLYLPPSWVDANASQIVAQTPMGTGENDYSFLLITGSTASNLSLPASFPFLPMDASEPDTNEPVLLAAYPAGFLGGQTIQMNLYASSAVSAVEQLFSFGSLDHVDVVSLGGTVVSQGGSSGGAVVSLQTGKLIGIIATDTSGTTTAARDLDAITLSHINRSLETEGQGSMTALLSQDLNAEANTFNQTTAPTETAELSAVLQKAQN